MNQTQLTPEEMRLLGVGPYAPRPKPQGTLADVADVFQRGALSGASGLAEGVQQAAGVNGWLGAGRGPAAWLGTLAGQAAPTLSPEGAEALAGFGVEAPEIADLLSGKAFLSDIRLKPGSTWKGALLSGAEALGSMAPFALGGAGLRGVLAGGGLARGAASALGFGALGGLAGGGGAAQQARDEMYDVPGGVRSHPRYAAALEAIRQAQPYLDDASLHRAAVDSLAESAAREAFDTAVPGSFAVGAVVGPSVDRLLHGEGGRLVNMLRGAATEGVVEEPLDQASQSVAVNRAMRPYDGRDVYQGVLSDALTAGLAAGLGGGAAGAALGRSSDVPQSRVQVEPEAVQPPPPEVPGAAPSAPPVPAEPVEALRGTAPPAPRRELTALQRVPPAATHAAKDVPAGETTVDLGFAPAQPPVEAAQNLANLTGKPTEVARVPENPTDPSVQGAPSTVGQRAPAVGVPPAPTAAPSAPQAPRAAVQGAAAPVADAQDLANLTGKPVAPSSITPTQGVPNEEAPAVPDAAQPEALLRRAGPGLYPAPPEDVERIRRLAAEPAEQPVDPTAASVVDATAVSPVGAVLDALWPSAVPRPNVVVDDSRGTPHYNAASHEIRLPADTMERLAKQSPRTVVTLAHELSHALDSKVYKDPEWEDRIDSAHRGWLAEGEAQGLSSPEDWIMRRTNAFARAMGPDYIAERLGKGAMALWSPEQKLEYAKSRREWFADTMAHALLSEAGYYADNPLAPEPDPVHPVVKDWAGGLGLVHHPDALKSFQLPTGELEREIVERRKRGEIPPDEAIRQLHAVLYGNVGSGGDNQGAQATGLGAGADPGSGAPGGDSGADAPVLAGIAGIGDRPEDAAAGNPPTGGAASLLRLAGPRTYPGRAALMRAGAEAETTQSVVDTGRPADRSEEGGEGSAGDAAMRIAKPTEMWVSHSGSALERGTEAPKPGRKGTWSLSNGSPNDAAGKALVALAAGIEDRKSVRRIGRDNRYRLPDGSTWNVSRLANGADTVWVAHPEGSEPSAAYMDGEGSIKRRYHELVGIGANQLGLRETETPESIEGEAEGFSPAFLETKLREIESHSIPQKEGTNSRQSPREAYGFRYPDGSVKRLDLPAITSLGRMLRSASEESAATDRQMLVRDDFLRGLGLIADKLGALPAGGSIPQDAILSKDRNDDATTWGDVGKLGGRIAAADRWTNVGSPEADDLQFAGGYFDDPEAWYFNAGPDGAGGDVGYREGDFVDRRRLTDAAPKSVEAFGLSGGRQERGPRVRENGFPNPKVKARAFEKGRRRDEMMRRDRQSGFPAAEPSQIQELYANEGGETEAFGIHALEEGQSTRDAGLGKSDGLNAMRGIKPQSSHAASSSQVSAAPGAKTITSRVQDLVREIAEGVLGIPTRIVLADEHALPKLIERYEAEIAKSRKEAAEESMDKDRRKALETRIKHHRAALEVMKQAEKAGKAAFLALDAHANPEDRLHVVYAPAAGRDAASRMDELLHELGHYVKRNAVDQLIDRVVRDEKGGTVADSREDVLAGRTGAAERRELMQGLFGVESTKDLKDLTAEDWWKAEEAFANNFVRWAKTRDKPRNALERFFKALGDKVRALWEAFSKPAQAKASKGFDAFLDALAGRAEGTRPATPLGKQYAKLVSEIQVSRHPGKAKAADLRHFTNPLAFAARSEKVKKAWKSTLSFLDDFSRLWRPVNTQMRKIAGDVKIDGIELAKHFHLRPGESSPLPTIHEEIRDLSAPRYVDMMGILKDIGGKDKRARYEETLDALVLQTPRADLEKRGLTEALRVRDYLEKLYAEANSLGLEIDHRADYFPLVVDKAKWNAEPEKVIDIIAKELLRERKLQPTEENLTKARNLAAVMHQKLGLSGVLFHHGEKMVEDSALWNEVFGPAFRYNRSRALSPEMHRALKDYYVKDLALLLNQYTHSLYKRAVFQKRFGMRDEKQRLNPALKLALALKEASRAADGKPPKLSAADLDRLVRVLIPAEMGTLGQNEITPGWRSFQSWAMLGLNMGLLPLSVLSNIVELGQVDVRNQKLFSGVSRAVKLLANGTERAELRKLAYSIGSIRDDLFEHVVGNAQDPAYQVTATQKLSHTYFRAIGMKWFSDFERIAALSVAKDALGAYAADPAKHAKALSELGITAAQVKAWQADPDGKHQAVRIALNRWVDGAILRPSASIRPAWGSDPRFAMFWHLRDYQWAFFETVLRRVWDQSKDKAGLAKATPWLMLAAATLPLAMVGYELRKELTQDIPASMLGVPVPNKQESDLDYLMNLANRSGLLGPMAYMVDAQNAADHGEFFLLSIAGPTVDKLQEFVLHDLNALYTLSHTLPVLAQSRVIREAVFGAQY